MSGDKEKKEYLYDAFISYRHAPLDMFVAQTLQKKLEGFKVPRIADKETKKLGKSGIKRIFRDRDELPLAGNLSDQITEALESSEYLIVICSPRVVESLWCQKEIETFIGLRGIDHVFAVLIEGEPEEAFPRPLCVLEKEVTLPDGTKTTEEISLEPLAADVRGANKKEIRKKLNSEMLRLAAPMIGCSYDDLKQRHKMRRLKRMLVTVAVAGAVCLGVGAVSTYQALKIRHQSREIQAQSEEIMSQSEETMAQSEEIQAQSQSLLTFQSQSLSSTALQLYEDGDRNRALLVALAGLPENLDEPDRPIVSDTEAALAEILQVYENNVSYKPFLLLEHDTVTESMTFDMENQRIVTTDQMDQIYSWDMENGSLLAKIQDPVEFAYSVSPICVSEGGVLCAGRNGVICLNSKDLSIKWEKPDKNAQYAAVSPDGNLVALVVDYRWIEIYQASDGLLISSYYDENASGSFGKYICFSEDGTKALFMDTVTDDSKGQVLMLDAATGEKEQSYTLPYTLIKEIFYTNEGECYIISYSNSDYSEFYTSARQAISCFNADGSRRFERDGMEFMDSPIRLFGENIALPGYCSVKILSREDGTLVNELHYVTDVVSISANGETNVIGAFLSDGSIQYDLIMPNDVYSVTYLDSTDGRMRDLISLGEVVVRQPYSSNQIYLYKFALGSQAEEICKMPVNGYHAVMLSGDRMIAYTLDKIVCVELSGNRVSWEAGMEGVYVKAVYPGEDSVIVVRTDGVCRYDAASGEEVSRYEGGYIGECQIKGEHLYLQDIANSSITVLNLTDLKEEAVYDNPGFNEFILSEDESMVVGNYLLSNDQLWMPETGEVMELPVKSRLLAVDPHHRVYLSADEISMTVALYEFGGQNPVISMECQISFIERMGFSPDGNRFYICYKDDRLEIYDREGFTLLKTFDELDEITEWREGPNEDLTLLCSDYGEAWLINEETELVYRLPGFQCISPDKDRIYSSGTTRLYSYPVYDLRMLVEEALSVLGDRQLTQTETEEYNIR